MANREIDNFLLIVGAMKCGTTSLFHYLAKHPQISACKAKEPNFFIKNNLYEKGFDFYENLWEYNKTKHKFALEASTSYSKLPHKAHAVERIYEAKAKHKVNFKFIYIIRNPIDRIISHCTHDLQERWSVKNKQLIVHGIPYRAIEISKYAMQLEAYYKRFPHEDILLLNFDDLKTRPKELLNQIYEFTGIDSNFESSSIAKQHNRSKEKMMTNSLWPKVDKFLVSPIVNYLPPAKRRKTVNTVRKYFETEKIIQKVELSELQIDYILQELKDDLLKLEKEYGVDISKWRLEI
ncbi:sulfotransferase domain protein [Leptolyngbya sp. PCC 7375]|nr:sulfotransferase domain protein [Leptolyngbya sp. PCC 7375]